LLLVVETVDDDIVAGHVNERLVFDQEETVFDISVNSKEVPGKDALVKSVSASDRMTYLGINETPCCIAEILIFNQIQTNY